MFMPAVKAPSPAGYNLPPGQALELEVLRVLEQHAADCSPPELISPEESMRRVARNASVNWNLKSAARLIVAEEHGHRPLSTLTFDDQHFKFETRRNGIGNVCA
jgi:hypothetical protein